MVARRISAKDALKSDLPPAKTPEARENQLINAAFDLAEQRLLAGTATSQEVVHFLRLGSSREKLEQARLANENRLTDAKIENLAAMGRVEALYEGAIEAMRAYSGQEPLNLAEDYDD